MFANVLSTLSDIVFGGEGDTPPPSGAAGATRFTGTLSDSRLGQRRCIFLHAELTIEDPDIVVARIENDDEMIDTEALSCIATACAMDASFAWNGDGCVFWDPDLVTGDGPTGDIHPPLFFQLDDPTRITALAVAVVRALRRTLGLASSSSPPLAEDALLSWYQSAQLERTQNAAGAATTATTTGTTTATAANPPAAAAETAIGEFIVGFRGLTLYQLDATETFMPYPAGSEGLAAVAFHEDLADADTLGALMLVFSGDDETAPSLVFPVNEAMFFGFHAPSSGVMWMSWFQDQAFTWCLRADRDRIEEVHQWMTRLLWQHKHQKPWRKLADKEQAWMCDLTTDAPPAQDPASDMEIDIDDPLSDDDSAFYMNPRAARRWGRHQRRVASELGASDDDADDDADDADVWGDTSMQGLSLEERNALMQLGVTSGRVFVSRGAQIGVFDRDTDAPAGLDFVAEVGAVRNAEDTIFSPSKMMLYQQDTSMLLLDPSTPNRVARMDLHRGEVVETFTTSDDYINTKALEVVPTTKYAGLGGDPTFVVRNNNSIFRMDPRERTDHQRIDSQSTVLSLARSAHLSCIATTADGDIVVGAKDGSVRLFARGDGIAKRCVRKFPGFGDPIIGIDTTDDGRFVLATCPTYLLLILTGDPTDRSVSGFQRRRQKTQRAPPIRLALSRTDVVALNGRVAFTPAHFDATLGDARSQRVIVTSTGPYIVTWNFARAARGDRHAYTISQVAPEHVVDHNLVPGRTDAVVLTTPNHVSIAQRRQ